jgi:NADP-dependent 3-hydroxy acid dehydrogenase YdfG
MKNFLSIGAGIGIGLATAERFAQEGYRVILSARNTEKVAEMAAELSAKGYTVAVESVDVANSDNVARLIADVESRFGFIDTIHYNAASRRRTTIDSLDAVGFQYDLSVNLNGAYATILAALPTMQREAEGTILLTGGGFALAPSPEFIAMSAGKAGIRALALGLFDDLKKRGVHIATVTVCAYVEPDSEAATAVANEFFQLRAQERDAWTAEATFTQ